MKNKIFCVSFTLFSGLIGAALYAQQMLYGMDASFFTEQSGRPLNLLSGLFAALCLLACFRRRGDRGENGAELLLYPPPFFILLRIAAVFGMLLAGVFGIMDYSRQNKVSVLVFALLTLFAGFSLLMMTAACKRGAFEGAHAFYSLVPVFWGCFIFMLIFKENASNPVIRGYFFQLIAGLCVMLAFYRICSFFFRRKGVWSGAFFCFSAAFFTCVHYGGFIIYRFAGGQRAAVSSLCETAGMFSAAVFLVLDGAMLLCGEAPRPEPAENPSGDIRPPL